MRQDWSKIDWLLVNAILCVRVDGGVELVVGVTLELVGQVPAVARLKAAGLEAEQTSHKIFHRRSWRNYHNNL